MDRRLTPFSGKVAHTSLIGKVTAPHFSEGALASVIVSCVDLCAYHAKKRDRQLIYGDRVRVVDTDGKYSFIQSQKDGYCGWVESAALGGDIIPTHWVAAKSSHLYSAPTVQAPEKLWLSFGTRVCLLSHQSPKENSNFAHTNAGFIPLCHLREMNDRPNDVVSVAEMFLGTPYLWGGNSILGLDCSGLVQTAFSACAQSCPADSDLQQSMGLECSLDAPFLRGDLLFWKGHVALAIDHQQLIHANGYSMSVCYENIQECIKRIYHSGGGDLIARRRVLFPQ